MNYEILEFTESHMLTRERFSRDEMPERFRQELEKRQLMSEAEIPTTMFEIMDHRCLQTRQAIHEAIIAAHAHGTGVIRTQNYGSCIFASNETELYQKIIGAMK